MMRKARIHWWLPLLLASWLMPRSSQAGLASDEALRLLRDWQLEDAREHARKLLLQDPEEPQHWALAGMVLHQTGHHNSALRLLDSAERAGVQTGWVHSLVRSSANYEAHFESITSEHFVVKYLNKDEIVASYAVPILEAAYQRIGSALDFFPAERGTPIVVEIYPDARGLAGATGLTVREIATSGTIAVCKFHRLMITSPLATADGYSWADTIAHEFVHLLISKKSNNTVPIWLHEGIAKFYESAWKGEPGQALGAFAEKLLAQATKTGKFITFEQMHPSMAKLPSQEDAALAFAEVFTTIEFIIQRYGKESVPRLLALLGEGQSLQRALRQVLNMDLKGLERAWRNYLKKRKFRIIPGAAPQKIRLASDEKSKNKEKPLETIDDRAVHDHSRLGELLQLRGRHRAAVIEYERAHNRAPHRYPTLTYRLARAYSETERTEEALSLLEKSLENHPDSTDGHLLAGRIFFAQKKAEQALKHFEAVRLQNPFNPEIHAALLELYRARGNRNAADQEERFLELSRKLRPTRSYERPKERSGTARLSVVTQDWSPIRIDGGIPMPTPAWDIPVDQGKFSIEYKRSDGSLALYDVTIAAGEEKRILLP